MLFSRYKESKRNIDNSKLGRCQHCHRNTLVDVSQDVSICSYCGESTDTRTMLAEYESYCRSTEARITEENKGLFKTVKRKTALRAFSRKEAAEKAKFQKRRKYALFINTFKIPLIATILLVFALIGLGVFSANKNVANPKSMGTMTTAEPNASAESTARTEPKTSTESKSPEPGTSTEPKPTAEPSPTPTPAPTPTPTTTTEPTAEPTTPPEDSLFEIYFLDVGQGDSSVVLCDGHAMLIDGGNNKQSSLIYSFLKKHGISHLDYIVASHPDSDHVGGLAGALNYATVDTAFCTATQHDTDAFRDFIKYLDAQNVSITLPTAGSTYKLGSADFTVLYPKTGNTASDNTSLIIRLTYGDTSFLFVGDSEIEDEKAVISYCDSLKSTVLKVGHHGSNSSSCYQFLYEVEPQYAVISVGGSNSYGHPTEEVLSRLHDADATTFRTDMQGDIHCVSDGTTVTFDVEKNPDADVFSAASGYDNWKEKQNAAQTSEGDTKDVNSSSQSGTDYVLNTNTYKFHYSWCSSVNQMKESNKKYIAATRDEIIAMGYSPCGRCCP